jgi:acetolactate synthase-1/3 small subunit
MRHVLGIRFDDAPETLCRLVRIVSTNDYRLESLSVEEAPSGRYATIVVEADSAAGELLQRRLERVVAVQTVRPHDRVNIDAESALLLTLE